MAEVGLLPFARIALQVSRAVFARAAADQRKDVGEMGAGASQAKSSGGSAGSAGAPVSRHAGAAGKGGGRLMRWKREKHMEIGKWKLENCKEKIPTHAAYEWAPSPSARIRHALVCANS